MSFSLRTVSLVLGSLGSLALLASAAVAPPAAMPGGGPGDGQLAALAAAPAPALAAPAGAPAAAPVPKTVILGFDGMDFALTSRFIAEGHLPHFARLAESGTFQPLETSNPAQSPVSWAVFNTGTNPGKTGVAGFVSRQINKEAGRVLPQPMLGFPDQIDAAPFVRFPMAITNRLAFVALVAAGGLVVGLLLFRLLLGIPRVVAVLLALGAGGLGGWVAMGYADSLPADGKLPYTINPMQGTNWWTYLDEAGVRLRGIQIPSTYPPDNEGPSTELLAGLGVPDIGGGGNGTFYVYTDDPWSFETSTDSGGEVLKIFEEDPDNRPGVFEAELVGPRNWIQRAAFDHRSAVLEERLDDPALSTGEKERLEAELAEVKAERKRWSGKSEKVTVPFVVEADREAGEVTFTLGDVTETVPVEGWSGFIPVEFVLNDLYSAHGVAQFHVLTCNAEEVRFFVPPISIDPRFPTPHLPISAPPEFSARLAEAVGYPYETLGWGCMINPVKDLDDTEFGPQSFLQDIAINYDFRLAILEASFDAADDWDVYYQVDGGTDRTAHILYREFDPEHPRHDPEYANRVVNAFGRSFPLKDAILEVYKEADRFLGRALERIDAGDLGPDVLVMVVSDHGFTSFRRGINLNNLLFELGYLETVGDKSPAQLVEEGGHKLLNYVDWERTQAYSMGLGKVFVNLAGREPKGIVPPAQYDAVIDAIRADLLALTDGDGGPNVVTSVSRRDELFSGPWWKEGKATRIVAGVPQEVEHDGFADLFLGYAPNYRVSWANTMGDLDREGIHDNTNHWSGDHVSVDPSHVQGILFANRRFAEQAPSHLLDIGPTMLVRYGIDPGDKGFDGRPLPLAVP